LAKANTKLFQARFAQKTNQLEKNRAFRQLATAEGPDSAYLTAPIAFKLETKGGEKSNG